MRFSMEKQAFFALFSHFLTLHGLEKYDTDNIKETFFDLTRLMLETNAVMNVTAIRDVEKIIPLHYIDCLLVADHFPVGATVIDVGCGGGFPTLPLAIARPDLRITGVDSTEKKVRYVAQTAEKLGLSNVKTISARAEELIQTPRMRESFDVATSRAVARLHILDELCLPFVKIGGKAVIMKGAAGDEEYAEAAVGIEKLGGRLAEIEHGELTVADNDVEKRTTILIDKINATPTQYPRQFGQIKKRPL